ncbi:MAG: efflux RND transporter periplasmic adaptor subunit [Desulfobacterales bacterium]|nr:MAG: efflux RND transporter periplasmic adaptor subunit [Desulfobacterales bacterium]
MKRILKLLLTTVLLVLFVGTIVFLYNKSREKPVVFETAQPFVTSIIEKTVATGSVVPRKEIEIKPQVSGIVEKLYVEPGDRVQKGDLIAKVKIIPDMVSVNNAEARVNKAELNLKDSRRECERRKNLYKKGIIAESEFLKYDLAYNNAQEELEAALNNLNLIREGVAQKYGDTTNTLIRSTIKGMVLDVPVEEGNFVIETNTFNEGTTIASVADMGEMIFKGKVDESEVGKIEPGMDLILTIGAIEKEKYDAVLEYIAPKGAEEKGAIQFEIKAKIKLKASYFIRAGYSANADIVLDRRDNVLAINESLLQFASDKPFVEVETAPQQFEKRPIQVGLSDGIKIEVVSGLDPMDKIKVWNKAVEK